MRHAAVFSLVLVGILSNGEVLAADRQKIRAANIGAQAVMTLVSGVIQGKVHSLSDVLRCVGSGAAAGYGSFRAKTLVGHGDVQTGWLVANLAISVSENAASGKNPLAQLGYNIGPIRIRAAIPGLDRGGDSYAYVDVSEYETIALIRAIQNNDRVRFRKGMISFERDTLYPKHGGLGPFDGTTWGVYPGVWVSAPREVFNHEVIHAIQGLQGDAVEPSFSIFTYSPASQPNANRRLIRFEHFKVGIVNMGSDVITSRRAYEGRWTEIEAYRLAQNTVP